MTNKHILFYSILGGNKIMIEQIKYRGKKGEVREGGVFEVAKGHVPPLKNRGDYVFGPSY